MADRKTECIARINELINEGKEVLVSKGIPKKIVDRNAVATSEIQQQIDLP